MHRLLKWTKKRPICLLHTSTFKMIFKSLILPLLSLAPLLPLSVSARLEARDAWSDQVVSIHNSNRAHYGAKPLTWSASLYPAALQWAQGCQFKHSNSGGRYGENLYVATGTSNPLTNGVQSWMAEASKYDYNKPGFSSATGHFTQVVWKSTAQVACAYATCAAGTIFPQASTYLVCRYTPPGNYAGQFPQNVGRYQ